MSALAAARFDNSLRYRDEGDPRQVQFTPSYILEPVREWLGTIDLDPYTTPDNPTGALRFYAPPEDGATLPWDVDTVFVNPPYGKARERWVRRCIDAHAQGSAVVLLIPAHTDTRIFHLALETATWIVFVRGRVKFGVLRPNRRQAAASHPSALIGWGDEVSPALAALGTPMEFVRQINRDPALQASPPTGVSDGAALDVERLARAIHAGVADSDCDGTCGRSAEIVAEYQRLAREQADSEPER